MINRRTTFDKKFGPLLTHAELEAESSSSFPHLLLLVVGTVKAVHAYRADLDAFSESLADLAPGRDTTKTRHGFLSRRKNGNSTRQSAFTDWGNKKMKDTRPATRSHERAG